MRLISVSITVLLALLPAAVPAQQSPGTIGDKSASDTIGHPPPLPGPPPLSDPSTTPPAASTPGAGDAAARGTTSAYPPAGPPPSPTPSAAAPLPPQSVQGPGLNIVAPDGVSTRTVRAVPCGVTAKETDGFTTCVGIPDQAPARHRHRR
jgi:hypothetical protein